MSDFSFSEFLSGDPEICLENKYLDSSWFFVPSRSSWDNWFQLIDNNSGGSYES